MEGRDLPGGGIDGFAGRYRGTRQRLVQELIDTGLVDWVFDFCREDLDGLSLDERITFAHMLLRPCTTCDAKPGARCVRRSNGVEIIDMNDQHRARRDLTIGPYEPTAKDDPD